MGKAGGGTVSDKIINIVAWAMLIVPDVLIALWGIVWLVNFGEWDKLGGFWTYYSVVAVISCLWLMLDIFIVNGVKEGAEHGKTHTQPQGKAS